MPAFSVIIPIYNGEGTLRRCLDSLRAQSFQDFEVLMMENGSADASCAICREYAAADSRFSLHIMAQNHGPSPARNAGLDIARGEYIAFVDCDDLVAPEHLARLHQAFTEHSWGAVFFGLWEIRPDGEESDIRLPQIPENATKFEILTALRQQDLFGYTGIKAFRADAIGNTRFPEDLELMEDEVFACAVLEKGCAVGVLPQPLYGYAVGNSGSLMGRTHADYCTITDAAYRAWKKLLAPDPRRDEWLREQAATCVQRCMYYGFERDVEPAHFFSSLADCEFFTDHPVNNRFYQAVAEKNIPKLRRMRRFYRIRVTLSNFLRK